MNLKLIFLFIDNFHKDTQNIGLFDIDFLMQYDCVLYCYL